MKHENNAFGSDSLSIHLSFCTLSRGVEIFLGIQLSVFINLITVTFLTQYYIFNLGAGKLEFGQLTDAQKTVITSVLFQYGSPRRTPNFWRKVTNQDWAGAEAELRNFGDKYPTRRNKEADLLKNDDGSKGQCETGSRRKRSINCPTRSPSSQISSGPDRHAQRPCRGRRCVMEP